jgi:hypothetical protein
MIYNICNTDKLCHETICLRAFCCYEGGGRTTTMMTIYHKEIATFSSFNQNSGGVAKAKN